MLRKIDWESQIGRRLKLRDLHVFCTVVQRGSMAKAARYLGVSHPAVSEVIADLEQALGVRLLDRSAQGPSAHMPISGARRLGNHGGILGKQPARRSSVFALVSRSGWCRGASDHKLKVWSR